MLRNNLPRRRVALSSGRAQEVFGACPASPGRCQGLACPPARPKQPSPTARLRPSLPQGAAAAHHNAKSKKTRHVLCRYAGELLSREMNSPLYRRFSEGGQLSLDVLGAPAGGPKTMLSVLEGGPMSRMPFLGCHNIIFCRCVFLLPPDTRCRARPSISCLAARLARCPPFRT